MARKQISKKLRFEVFKRDSFKCQYCGRSSPDVILNVDHMLPVAEEGDNDILNLITSCFDCNSGKGARLLSDATAVAKKKDQLDELQERREQLEMLIEWKQGLVSIDDEAADKLIAHWHILAPGWVPTEEARRKFIKAVKKHGVEAILNAMEVAANQYLVFDGDKVTGGSWETAWSKIPGICRVIEASEKKPYLKDLYYIRGILRKRLSYVSERDLMNLMEDAIAVRVTIDQLKDLARRCNNWTEFRSVLENTISHRQGSREDDGED